VTTDDRDYFLSIAGVSDTFENSAELRRVRTPGEVRSFNPFLPTAFEPENASLVVFSYIQRAHAQLRSTLPRWQQRFCFRFIDYSTLSLRIDGFAAVPPETQRAFRKALGNIPRIQEIDLAYDRKA
jgi:hypothetical protein